MPTQRRAGSTKPRARQRPLTGLERQELHRLREENRLLREERDLLAREAASARRPDDSASRHADSKAGLVKPKSVEQTLRDVHGVTPGEARVAMLLLEGLPLRTIAGQLGISIHTVRTHLKRVLAKTGTRNQGDLIRVLLSEAGKNRSQ